MSWKKLCKTTCRALSPISRLLHTEVLVLICSHFSLPLSLVLLSNSPRARTQIWSDYCRDDQEIKSLTKDKRTYSLVPMQEDSSSVYWKEPPTKKKKTEKSSDLQQSNQNCWTRVPFRPWCRWKQDGSWRKLLMTCKTVRVPACRAALQQQLGYNIPYCCQLPV
jgi:hypothetical protein